MREWESGRVGEWENGRLGEWENGRTGETDKLRKCENEKGIKIKLGEKNHKREERIIFHFHFILRTPQWSKIG